MLVGPTVGKPVFPYLVNESEPDSMKESIFSYIL